MGLLDDAIREHLELKRRHGADPQEVARQEDEALGPIGGGQPHAAAEPQDEPEHAPEPEPEHEPEEPPTPYEAPAATLAEEPADQPPFDVAQPTVEFSIEDEHEDAAPAREPQDPEAADELEETPEFLQETPEHDRLWFEQKPPRDFDF